MFRQLLIVASLSWAAIAVPTLCNAGILEHACACGVASMCSHEEDCSLDPCVTAKPATESQWVLKAPAPAPALLPIRPFAEIWGYAASASSRYAIRSALAVPPALRFGARPLLI